MHPSSSQTQKTLREKTTRKPQALHPDIQAKALAEGMPYQTLIASVLHKYVSGRFVEKTGLVTGHSRQTARKRAAG